MNIMKVPECISQWVGYSTPRSKTSTCTRDHSFPHYLNVTETITSDDTRTECER